MDKSEGKDFISRTFGNITEKITKLYQKGHKAVSLSSLKKNRSEKLAALGDRVYQLLLTNEAITAAKLKDEYASIKELDKDIQKAEDDLKKLDEHKVGKKQNMTPKKLGKESKSKKTTSAKTKTAATKSTTAKSAKTATAKKSTVKKTAATKATTTKTAAAKKNTAIKPAPKNTIKLAEQKTDETKS